ncbi:MAG: ACP S-malonyltransferase [Odoribacteraceae bacterium]|jgi:[acyl-carrier-protein] S-malonyltransferase|nr:ACP S-malonyltransferase [Odoribacteraceae bacterium]
MKRAFVFPGQGAQFTGMGQHLYESSPSARRMFERANDLLGFRLTDLMFSGTSEELRQTRVTQPAIFLHSVVLAASLEERPAMVAGHSLGEFSALVANGTLSFEDGLRLVSARAMAMQKACGLVPSTMAAVLGLPDEVVEEVLSGIDEVVVTANYNCPGQLVISGTREGINMAAERLKTAGAKRVLPLSVGGAFHSPLMEPARQELAAAIRETPFATPICPVYQNVDALPVTDPAAIRQKLIDQLTAPVRWTRSVQNMVSDGATAFLEIGPGKVLQGLVAKIAPGAETAGIE